MSLPVKRQLEESAGVNKVVETGAGKQQQQQQQQQHVGGGGAGMVMESANVFGGEAESRPAKVARRSSEEKPELFSIGAYSTKPGRDGGGEALVGDSNPGISSKEAPVPQLKIKVREFGGGDREAGRMDLERKASGGKEYGEVGKESNKEVLGRVDVKGEEQLQGGGTTTTGEVGGGQELADIGRGEGNSEGLRKKSPRESEGKIVVKDGPTMEVKREDFKEKDKKEERKEDVGIQHHQQLLQPYSDVNSEKEKDEMERDKGEKEKERVRERSRDREKEAVARSEKREKREKERDRDSHRREEREDSLVDKLEKVEGKAIKIEETDTDRKPVDDRKLVEKEGRVRDRDKDKDEEGEGEKRKKRGREQEKDRDSLNATDTEGAGGEKDKDGVQQAYGVQQRKRMLRPRGQLNPANRDSRSRFRPKDNEGTQG